MNWPSDWKVTTGYDGPILMSHTLLSKNLHGYVAVIATTPEEVARVLNAYRPLVEMLKAIVPKEDNSEWWCPTCQEWLPGSRVTYQECCDTCGTRLTSMNDPEWATKAHALLKSLGEEV